MPQPTTTARSATRPTLGWTLDGLRALVEAGVRAISRRRLAARTGNRRDIRADRGDEDRQATKSDRLRAVCTGNRRGIRTGRPLARRSSARVLLCALLLLLPAPAWPADGARELNIEELSPWKGWTVRRFKVSGLPRSEARALRSGLVYDGEARWLGLFGRRRPALSRPQLANDLNRARLHLARQGYPQAELQIRIRPQPARRRLDLELAVETGPAARVASLQVTGLPAQVDSLLRSALVLQPGSRFRDAAYEADRRRLADGLRSHGHARASCEGELQAAVPGAVEVRFQVEPGPVNRIADLSAGGVTPDLERLALRQLEVLVGLRYDPRRLAEVRDRLRLLGVYRQIRLELQDLPRPAGPEDLRLHADLSARPPRTLEAGLGFWSAEGWRASATWRNANLLRGGRGGELRGSLSQLRQLGRARLWWPGLFGRLIGGEIGFSLDRQTETSFRSLDRELRLSARWRPSLLATLSGGISFANVDLTVLSLERIAFQARPGLLTTFHLDWMRDSSNDPFDPSRGTVFAAQAEWTVPGLLSDSDFLRLSVERSGYRRLGPAVGAMRLRLGAAWPLADSRDLLPTRRFFAGGPDHRGFARRQLGPRDRAGGPLGGEALVLGSAELRWPLTRRLSAVLFVDAGQVWPRWQDLRSGDLELAAGPGLLLRTPVGPVRGDIGMRLGPADDRPGWAAHVSIGHPF
jgi:outer membrane translocation and assembly module TamA